MPVDSGEDLAWQKPRDRDDPGDMFLRLWQRSCEIVFAAAVFALVSCASDPPLGPSNDSQFAGEMAGRAGLENYSTVAAEAISGRDRAMAEMFRVTPFLQAQAAVEHANTLWSMLQRTGDQKFAIELSKQPRDIQVAVGQAIRRYLGMLKPGVSAQAIEDVLRGDYPQTYALIGR
jgi:hypothetical protein